MDATHTYMLHLADDALIMSQRLSEWTGHGPELEQDIALTNIALDYLGQARLLYQHIAEQANASGWQVFGGQQQGGSVTEDDLAMLRLEQEYRNHLLVELPNGHWGQTVLKLFFFSTYQKLLLTQLTAFGHEPLAAIAAKSLKEVTYHQRWSAEWVIRLGAGTAQSQQRMQQALAYLWPFTAELFEMPGYMPQNINLQAAGAEWQAMVERTLKQAELYPDSGADLGPSYQTGGLQGRHTEHLGYLLAEMQYMQRAYPNMQW
ncbi:MAG TPA: phenylacetate-CoA oxygenase subunit PaaC [Phnomibacter sp.]|nr:phenylacetate-CoA oxygenase subunit PaaC [Phnomibacter sp.]